MHRLAIYDMDKTITYAPTWTSFLVETARAESPWRLALLPLVGFNAARFAAGVIDRGRLKEIAQRLLLGPALPEIVAARAAARFADRIVACEVYPAARAQIAEDRMRGYRVVLATASYRFYASAIAARLGIDDVIATDSARGDRGAILPRIAGENCYGPAKLGMIEAWMASRGIARGDAEVRFYSDHVSDAPTLAWADTAIAVNAHGPLRVLAETKGWQVLDWER